MTGIILVPLAGATHTTPEGLASEGCAVTKGGWGAEPNGHNPGALLHAWFDTVFGANLVVGDLTFADAQAVTDFLPNEGFSNVEEQAVALAINIAFGDAGLLNGTISDIEATSLNASYDGKTAVEILAIAEAILLSDPTPSTSEYSDLVLVMTNFNMEIYGCHEAPDCPDDVVASALSDGTVRLEWSAVAGAVEYNVYRGADGGDLVFLDSTTDTNFTDATVGVGVTYEYMITAWDGTLESELCDSVEVTAVPFFGAPLLGAAALVGCVGAYRWLRRKA